MSQRDDLLARFNRQRRVLQKLEEQKAGFGSLHAPAHLQIEIEDAQAEIVKLEAELAALEELEPVLAPAKELEPSPGRVKQPEPGAARMQPLPDVLAITTPIYMELVRIPAGEFAMGTRAEDIPDLMERYGGEQEFMGENGLLPAWCAHASLT
jgi:formylglycine-generating enzyme required for sulfatase activity